MELSKFIDLTESITYKGKPCVKVSFIDWRNNFAPVPQGYVYVSIWIHAFDVEDGKPTKIEGGGLQSIKDLESTSEWSHLTWIKNEIVSLETHEVEETFAVGGNRVFNPHERYEKKVEQESALKVA